MCIYLHNRYSMQAILGAEGGCLFQEGVPWCSWRLPRAFMFSINLSDLCLFLPQFLRLDIGHILVIYWSYVGHILIIYLRLQPCSSRGSSRCKFLFQGWQFPCSERYVTRRVLTVCYRSYVAWQKQRIRVNQCN